MNRRGRFARIVLALCLAVGLTVFFSARAMAEADDSEAIVGVVSTFYQNYIERITQALDSGEKSGYDFRKQPEVDAVFVRKIDELFREAEGSEEGLGYDPIIMGQDFPNRMEYAKPVIKDGSAELIVYRFWGGTVDAPKDAVCVSLAKRDSGWRITDVIDMQYEETKKECGGQKTGQKISN